jgi:hypothetical protein
VGQKAPNIKSKFLEFLISLSSSMTKHQTFKINYKFIAGEVEDGPPWARRFFGDPYEGKDPKKLELLEMIRSNLTCLIIYDGEMWRFLHDTFVEKLDSINTLELSRLESRFRAIDPKTAKARSIQEFSIKLFSAQEGPYLSENLELPPPAYQP